MNILHETYSKLLAKIFITILCKYIPLLAIWKLGTRKLGFRKRRKRTHVFLNKSKRWRASACQPEPRGRVHDGKPRRKWLSSNLRTQHFGQKAKWAVPCRIAELNMILLSAARGPRGCWDGGLLTPPVRSPACTACQPRKHKRCHARIRAKNLPARASLSLTFHHLDCLSKLL